MKRLWAAVGAFLLVATPSSGVMRESHAVVLTLADPVHVLPRGYGLGVVPLPDLPAVQPTVAVAQGCPIVVRGIVGAESRSFALIDNHGDSALVHKGDIIRTARGVFSISAVGSNRVVLQQGDALLHCALVRR